MPHHVDITLSEWSPRLYLNAQLTVVGNVILLRHERMHLYLVDDGSDLGIREQIVQMMTVEVAHADGLYLALSSTR